MTILVVGLTTKFNDMPTTGTARNDLRFAACVLPGNLMIGTGTMPIPSNS
jgi:hypothetical protein